MKRFVIGDIHGAFLGLKQVLEMVNFNYEEDLLISLGDLCDGWPDVRLVINEVMKIKNFQMVMGNHDKWFLEYSKDQLDTGEIRNWLHHGEVLL